MPAVRDCCVVFFVTVTAFFAGGMGALAQAAPATATSAAAVRTKAHDEREAAALEARGHTAVLADRYTEAIAAFKTSFDLFRRLDDERGETDVLTAYSGAAVLLGQYEDALVALTQALAIDRRGNAPSRIARDLGGLGNVAMRLGRPLFALNLQEQALAIDRDRKDAAGQARDFSSIGVDDVQLGRYADGVTSEQQAQSIHHRLRDGRGEANDLNNIGLAQMGLAQLDLAGTALHMSLALHRAQNDRLGAARNLINLAVIAARSNDDALAIRDGQEAATLAEAIAAPEPTWRAHSVCADAEARSNLQAAALADYAAALDSVDSLRGEVAQDDRSSFLSGKLFIYDRYIAYLRELDAANPGAGFDRKALDVLERKESRALLDQIGGSAAQHFNGVSAGVLIEDRTSLAALQAAQAGLSASAEATRAKAQATFAAAVARRRSFEQTMQRTQPAYYALLHPIPATAGDLQQRVLGSDEALLSYDVLPQKSILFVLTRDRLVMLSLPGSAVLAASVARVRAHITTLLDAVDGGILPGDAIAAAAADDLPGFAADSRQLYDQLMPAGVADLLAGKKLIIVPSGPLYDLPWEALVTQAQGPTVRYLIEDHAISYIPSGSLLGVVRAAAGTQPAREPLLAFANPAYGGAQSASTRGPLDALRYTALRDDDGGGFPDLPGTAVEAGAVRDALHAGAASVISGEDATRARVLALNQTHGLEKYRYLLFATHAVLPDTVQGINQPALVLAHPDRDGFLTMADVFGLSLDADFVALSACNTGLGARLSGEGISGLTRAFLYAGTPAISVTLWEVDDTVAPRITPAFFAGMRSGLSAAEALRGAKLALIRSSDARLRHPYAWAPTVIFGDGTSERSASGALLH